MSEKRNYSNNKSRKEDIDGALKTVLESVEDGLTIEEALGKIDMSKRTFYRHLSEEPKNLLRMTKISKSRYGCGAGWSMRNIDYISTYLQDEATP
jgi:hypothetical protein